MLYRIELTEDDNGTFLVTAPDLPEVTTYGETAAECMAVGSAAVSEAIAARLATFADIPRPTTGEGPVVAVDPLIELKAKLLWTLTDAGMTRADLVRALGVHRPQVDRLFDPSHASRLDQMSAAFRALGKRIEVDVRDAA